MDNYMVYWYGIEKGFKKFKDALDFAKERTKGEIKFDTALIVNRKNPNNVRIYTLTWIVPNVFQYSRVEI